MTPAARIEAAIGILDSVLLGTPAEAALLNWARGSRYAGSKDRASVRDHVYQALRCRNSYACLGGSVSGRGLMIGALRANDMSPEELFTGEGYSPSPLTTEEKNGGRGAETLEERFDLPGWLVERFSESLGEDAEGAALTLTERAPIVLRVNSKKASRPDVIKMLALENTTSEALEICPTALGVTEGARRLTLSAAFKNGLFELQDGSSQAAMEKLPIPKNGKVLDYCAGGGGKVLALAARAQANWFAHDADMGRMKDIHTRTERAGCDVTLINSEDVAKHAPYDLVLCDVPCSGSGTWRRTPDAKWKLTPQRLRELVAIQTEILSQAGALIRKDGILAYSTCSVLNEENEMQISALLEVSDNWSLEHSQRWPIGREGDGFYLSLLRRI